MTDPGVGSGDLLGLSLKRNAKNFQSVSSVNVTGAGKGVVPEGYRESNSFCTHHSIVRDACSKEGHRKKEPQNHITAPK